MIKGYNPNNYVWYSGNLWRVVSFDETGNARLVTDDVLSAFSYHNSLSTWSTSFVNTWLNDYFYSRLNSNKTSLLMPTSICLDATSSTSTARTTCSSSATVNVGLLSLDEYNLIGASSSYLNNGNTWWTVSPFLTTPQTSIYVVELGGMPVSINAWSTQGIRPVITVRADAIVSSGTGTVVNPYRLKEDSSGEFGSSLNERNSGEYVSYNGKLWKLIETNDIGVKAIYDGPQITNFGSNGNIIYGNTPGALTKTTGVGQIASNMLTDTSKIVTNVTWYQGTYTGGTNPFDNALKEEVGIASSVLNVGLPRIGELYTGQRRGNQYYYWTMTPYSTQAVWMFTSNYAISFAPYNSGAYGVRPVIYFKKTNLINGGTGTIQNPYLLK